jgi:hypothetical protein
MPQGMNSNYWLETITPLGSNGTFTSAARDAVGSGGSSSSVATFSPWAKFSCVANSNQAGTFIIQGAQSVIGTWYSVGSGAVSANVPTTVTVPVVFEFYQVVYTNGASAQASFNLSTAFTTS